ncbi:MAG: hypothetical protein IID41_03850 [Planctomycetes bacterium]|nr:hypothetical protein [Planctomycetota bacterium]
METLMTKSGRLLCLRACCALSLTVAQSTLADTAEVNAGVRTDLTICQHTRQNYIDEPLTVSHFFAVFDDPTGRLLYASNDDIDQDGSMQEGETS